MNSYKFFKNIDCKYYPCHDIKEINCIFCYCALYHDNNCEGTYIIRKNGIKDCSQCILPHSPMGFDYIIDKLKGGKE
jgi:Zn-finger protein